MESVTGVGAFRAGWQHWKTDRKLIPAFRALLHRALPPAIFEFVRMSWWCLWFYVPRTIASWFQRSAPAVHGFGAGSGSELVEVLRRLNTKAPTKMCFAMTKHGSDKAHRWHNYTTVYSVLFKGLDNRNIRLFELGLGTNNPALASTMGAEGRPGASLRGWREIFPKGSVSGADIDRDILFQEDRIKTFYCDQLNSAAIRDLWARPELQEGADVIIEDGLHTFEANISFLEGSLDYLRPGGFYVIEDIVHDTVEQWYERLKTVYAPRYPTLEFAFVRIPNKFNSYDNNLLVIRKPA